MSTPFIPFEQLQTMITSQLLQSLKRGPGAPPINVASLQLQQLTSGLNSLKLPDLKIPDNF
jgi:hypothetical protein